MKLLNPWTDAKELVDRFVRQYGDRCDMQAKILLELGANPSPDEVDMAFESFPADKGRFNRVCRTFTCHGCGDRECEEVVLVGLENPDQDYDSHTCQLCARCLIRGLRMLDADAD